MSASFNTTINMPLKGWYLPLINGIIYIIASIWIFSLYADSYMSFKIVSGVTIITSGLTILLFTLRNRKAINGWGWYMVYGILILGMAIYLFFYTGDSVVFYIGFVSLLRSIILTGTAIDLKRHEHQKWGKIALVSMAGILFSVILLAGSSSPDNSAGPIITAVFMSTGISSILLSSEFKKVNLFYKRVRKLAIPK
ncbi:hypothetical protein [Elizabethkingia occulta]|uniref:hypothetical protein n=1 Tax=Elizabethkingia occulta TaxID=1867263 RepID=UPI0009D10AFF|nr:hypothetical protein [Elizabethkingia occulta]OPB86483.1 hypothetical protein BB020_06100 [Elizabethkingia occulta]